MNNDYNELHADSVTVKYARRAVGSDGITKFYTADTVYACMGEQTDDQMTAYRRLMGHEADLVTTGDAVDINRLREKAAVLESERDALRRKLDRLYGLMGDVRADQELLKGNWATEKETYEKRIQEQAEAINRASKYSDAQRGAIDRLTARVHELEVDRATSETAKVEYEKTIDELKAQIRELKTDRATSETVSATAKVEYEKHVQEQAAKIDSLLQDNLSLNAQLEDKDHTIKLLQDMLADRAWEHASKRLDIGTIEETVELKKTNADLKKPCEELKLTVEKITETNAKTVTNMSTTIADLKEKNRNLRSRIEELEADAKALRRRTCEDGRDKHLQRLTIRELKKQIDQLQGTVVKTKEQLDKSLEQRARLQSSLEELMLENASLRGKLVCFESFRP